jgi:hypothetical protein
MAKLSPKSRLLPDAACDSLTSRLLAPIWRPLKRHLSPLREAHAALKLDRSARVSGRRPLEGRLAVHIVVRHQSGPRHEPSCAPVQSPSPAYPGIGPMRSVFRFVG